MKENITKSAFAAAIAGVSAYFHVLLLPLVVLTLAMLGDYLTGLARGWMTNSLSSRTGVKGIVKKACYLLVVAVGMTVDWVIKSALVGAGATSPKTVFWFGLLVTIWLIINELISILENLSKIGVPLPTFLKSTVKRLKIAVENSANTKEDQQNGI